MYYFLLFEKNQHYIANVNTSIPFKLGEMESAVLIKCINILLTQTHMPVRFVLSLSEIDIYLSVIHLYCLDFRDYRVQIDACKSITDWQNLFLRALVA